MSRMAGQVGLLLACILLVSVCDAGIVSRGASAGMDHPGGPPNRSLFGCPNDADCDGIPDNIEAAVGGAGISLAAGTAATSATLDPDGRSQIALASTLLQGQASVSLPPGTTAGATPITLELGVDPSSSGPFVVVSNAQLAAGQGKAVTLPLSSSLSVVVLADSPDATSASLRSAPPSSRFYLPPCPCPSSVSTNILGQATPYTITNNGDNRVQVTGLSHSAVGMTNALDATGVPLTASQEFSPALAWPNPFTNQVSIVFSLASAARVRMEVFDVVGRRVRVSPSTVLGPGRHSLAWDGHADDGSTQAEGIYFLRVRGPGIAASRTVVRMK